MPPLPVALTMSVALPWLSPHGRGVVNTLLATVGQAVSVDELATRIGVGNRFRLARLLRREGLPPCGELADWTCALQLLWEAESSGLSLLQIADHSTLDPATCYRLFMHAGARRTLRHAPARRRPAWSDGRGRETQCAA